MRHRFLTPLAVGVAVIALCSTYARGDWKEGDPYKMHYPQLPDPNGWDVMATAPVTIADDWQCSETGPVTDIHFWGSWKANVVGKITNAHLSIHADVPPGPGSTFSHPGQLLWSWDVEPTLIGNEPASPQGWYDPSTGSWNRPDHDLWYQYNIVNIPNPWIQEKGTIYWLDLSITTQQGTAPTLWGWKTSRSPHFNDDAVWSVAGAGWQPITDPTTGLSLDMAFVITPEPSSLVLMLLTLAATGLGGTRKRTT